MCYWLNANIGRKKYIYRDSRMFVKEGFNKAESLRDHTKRDHPDLHKLFYP